MSETETMEDFAARYTRYRYKDFNEAWQHITAEFVTLSPEERKQRLTNYDASMAQETKVSRAHAEWITKKRQLDDLDAALLRVGR